MTTIESVKSLFDKSKDYLDTKIELTKLKTIDKSADVLSALIVIMAIFLIAFLFIILISIAFALMIGRALGSYYYGFFILGGFYAIILLIFYLQREKWIKTPVANGIINKMLK
jgi:uncharacterized RDD family membrane protein YckC